MTITTEKFARKPFVVNAVQVTSDNMAEVAKWCDGDIRTSGEVRAKYETPAEPGQKYIKVEVKRAINARQTQAFVGDWVLEAGTGFKVYTDRAFENSFEPVLEEDEGVSEDDHGMDVLMELLDKIETGVFTVEEVRVALRHEPVLTVVSNDG